MSSMHGWLAIDKPYGITSTDVVRIIKRLTKVKKIGHGGTLDPLATGILPIALGEATKTSSYIMNKSKIYEFVVQFGEQRTTDDLEGEILYQSDKVPSYEQIEKVLPEFIGLVTQMPPIYSAKKINGERAYNLVRRGQTPAVSPCEVNISSIKLVKYDINLRQATFVLTGGKGVYIRSVGRDLGDKLGCYGYILKLKRVNLGVFSTDNIILLESLKEIVHNNVLDKILLPLDFGLDDIPAICVASDQIVKIKNGASVVIDSNDIGDIATARLVEKGKLIAMGKIINQTFFPYRVFNY